MRGDLARSHAKAVRGSAQELMHKWPCMVGATALERLQTHSFVILVHMKVINFYTVPFLINVLSLISVNCTWSAWSPWTSCSATCGGGTHLRMRIVDQAALNGGEVCQGSPLESQACGTTECPAGMVCTQFVMKESNHE